MSARGEGFIPIGDDREVEVLFTNRALAKFERRTKKSVLGVLQGLIDGTSGVEDIAYLLREGMDAARKARGNKKPATIGMAYGVLDKAGFSKVTQVVMESVSAVLSYGQEEETDDDYLAAETDDAPDDLDDLDDLDEPAPKNEERSDSKIGLNF